MVVDRRDGLRVLNELWGSFAMDPRTAHIKFLCMMRQVWYDTQWAECKGLTSYQQLIRSFRYRRQLLESNFWLGPYDRPHQHGPEDNERCIELNQVAVSYRAIEHMLDSKWPKRDWGALPHEMYDNS